MKNKKLTFHAFYRYNKYRKEFNLLPCINYTYTLDHIYQEKNHYLSIGILCFNLMIELTHGRKNML